MDLKERCIESELQEIKLVKKKLDGFVLDIGGGGEGIIGKIYKNQTVSIDNREEELLDTNNDALKIVMDATDLKFINDSFDMTTFFYSLMYMDNKTKKSAIKEATRVLKNGGVMEIWDTELPHFDGGDKDIFIANVLIHIDNNKLKTGYGINYSNKHQTQESIINLLTKNNLTIVESEKSREYFHITAKKNHL